MEEKPKQGRPKKDPARHKRNRTLSLTDEEWAKLTALATGANRGISEYVIEQFGLNKP